MKPSTALTPRRASRRRQRGAPEAEFQISELCQKIARSLIGRTVDLLVSASAITHTISHGVVTGVFTEAGRPKLVVGGLTYDPRQVLMVTPTQIN